MINTCFVIMGYNVKTSEDGKEYNLNLSYDNIIKPVVEDMGITCIRADEIMVSEMIDDSMYKLLLGADLVVADITTLNVNAIYELGIRYALKPFSTILICSDDFQLPFDLNHQRVFYYKHNGEFIESSEIELLKSKLLYVIDNIKNTEEAFIDSPIYRLLPELSPPKYEIKKNYFQSLVSRYKSKDSFGSLIKRAYIEREKGNFQNAINFYEDALLISKDDYIVKEIAMCIYQEGTLASYKKALSYLSNNIDNLKASINPEILKTLGTLYKKIWIETKGNESLELSLQNYERSYYIYPSYNSGINYAFMLVSTSNSTEDDEKKTMYRLWSKRIYSEVKKICEASDNLIDYWVQATLTECYLGLNDFDTYEKRKENLKTFPLEENEQWKFDKTIQQLDMLESMIK